MDDIIVIKNLVKTYDTGHVQVKALKEINLSVKQGEYIVVEGQLRSYNRYIDGRNRLILTIFARELYSPSDEEELKELLRKPNEIYLDGFICKAPIYRTTPFGREITDLLVAVNRPYNKSDYIPSIAWGRNARYCKGLEIGDNIRIWGRLQSREYQKKLGEEEVQTKIAYEVSISKMEKVSLDIESECSEMIDVENEIITQEEEQDAM